MFIWDLYWKVVQSLLFSFRGLLSMHDEKVIAYTCMALHTCLNDKKVEQLTKQQDSLAVGLKVVELCRTQPELDWTYVTYWTASHSIILGLVFILCFIWGLLMFVQDSDCYGTFPQVPKAHWEDVHCHEPTGKVM